MDDNLIIDPRAMPELNTPEQARNYVEEKIRDVADQMQRQPPPPTNQLNALPYIKWERRLLILHGQAVGALQALQAFDLLSVQQFQVLKNKIIGTMLRRAANVQMGLE